MALKAIVPPQLSNREWKALEREIRKQCVEKTTEYEFRLDTVWLYLIHTELGVGKRKISEFYDKVFTERENMKQRFMPDEGDAEDLSEFAMAYKLKQDGIDIAKMFNEHEHKLKSELKK